MYTYSSRLAVDGSELAIAINLDKQRKLGGGKEKMVINSD